MAGTRVRNERRINFEPGKRIQGKGCRESLSKPGAWQERPRRTSDGSEAGIYLRGLHVEVKRR